MRCGQGWRRDGKGGGKVYFRPPARRLAVAQCFPRRHRQQRFYRTLIFCQLRRLAGMDRCAINTAVNFTGDRGGQLPFRTRQTAWSVEDAFVGQRTLL